MATQTLPDLRNTVSATDLRHEKGLYRHTKRDDWGLAILAWEENGRRAYQFDDGKLRVFKEGYYSLMEPADDAAGHEKAVVNDLRQTITLNKSARSTPLEPVYPFSTQLQIFTDLYPDGFQDGDWLDTHRQRESGRALKRHHGVASKRAQEALAAPVLDLYVNDERFNEAHDAILDILRSTDLIPVKRVRTLEALDDAQKAEFVHGVRHLLYGEGPFGARFKDYMRLLRQLLGERPSWRFATALPALVQPNDHVCVRHGTFIRQAASIAPDANYTRKPRRGAYKNFRLVAQEVRRKLQEAGHEPADLLDVHDFIWTTLRPAAANHVGS